MPSNRQRLIIIGLRKDLGYFDFNLLEQIVAEYNLPTEIARLLKRKANLNIALAEIDKIAAQYNVDLSDAHKGKKGKVEKPVLIISESFE